uniref:site-specific DNA-methyltransferase (adenine-specific) n=1 Tax=viral metagenome TaxID=1070528 RepID=A0A6C0KU40_9ZZZZ
MAELSCPTCFKVYKLKCPFEKHIQVCKSKKSTDIANDVKIKPFLKWVGGKTQILDEVLSLFPDEMNNYHEPFLGGGSVLLGLLSSKRKIHGEIYASDLNDNLIYLYKNIQTNAEPLIQILDSIVSEFVTSGKGILINRKPTCLEDAMTSQESYYYWIRSKFNSLQKSEKNSTKASAMLLFLNKTCFRGVYREGPNGYNVPFGNYKNPLIYEPEHLREISRLIKNVHFNISSFTDSLAKIKPGDFVYLDPPYAPEKDTSFVNYTVNGFDMKEHKSLFEFCDRLSSKFLMSNADVKFVKDSFLPPTYTTKIIQCRRAINSKNPNAKTNEVLIWN